MDIRMAYMIDGFRIIYTIDGYQNDIHDKRIQSNIYNIKRNQKHPNDSHKPGRYNTKARC